MEKLFDNKIENPNFAVIKHNTMIESGYDLPPAQNNIMTIASVKAREVANSKLWTGEVVISAKEYSDIHGVDISVAYKLLKKAALEMKETELICDAYMDLSKCEIIPELPNSISSLSSSKFYSDTILPSKPKHDNFKKMKLHIRLINKIGYSDVGSFIYLQFSEDVLHLIQSATQENKQDYTTYDYVNTINLLTTPAKRLYELAVKWKKLGSCKKSVDDWKILFGVFDKYKMVAEFKKWVLLPAINQINNQSEFELSFKQEKVGRIITHIILVIKVKQNLAKNHIESQSKRNLTQQELDIIHATANSYIAKSNVTTENHKANILKKAIAERWGLDEYHEQQKDLNQKNAKIEQEIKQKQIEEEKRHREMELQKQEEERFIARFESHSPDERLEILMAVEAKLKGIPAIAKIFEKERAAFTAHKNIMLRPFFKEVMSNPSNLT